MVTIQNYVRPKTLEEAYQLNQKKGSKILGGMLWLKMGSGSIQTAIDLCELGLDTITETDEAFSIGAMVSLRQLELHPALNAYTCGVAAEAVRDIVGVQFRNLATVGGSIWGRFGFSDVLTAFLAMDSYVELYHGGILPLEDFTAMQPDHDILVRLIVKKTPGTFTYQAMRNQRTDFPVLTCALSSLMGEHRAVIGARPTRALICRDTQGILDHGIDEAKAEEFAAYVADRIPTSSNVRGGEEYRTHLIRVLTQRCAMKLGGVQ